MKPKIFALFAVLLMFAGVLASCQKDEKLLLDVAKSSKFDDSEYQESETFPHLRASSNVRTANWKLKKTVGGISLLEDKNKKWYVIGVNLSQASVIPIYEKITEGTSPIFKKYNMESWNASITNAVALINASFFNFQKNSGDFGPWGYMAQLPHNLGYNNNLIATGYDPYEANQQFLLIKNNRASVSGPISSSSYQLLLSGFHPIDKKVKADKKIGRTMVGVVGSDKKLIYFFVTGRDGGATQEEARLALVRLGCSDVVMLDGSGSSQAAWQGNMLVYSSDKQDYGIPRRRIPVILGIKNR